MKTLKPMMLGLCLTAAGPAMAAPAGLSATRHAVASWTTVPDAVLSRLRGGIDLGNLVAYFAIERVVEVDGEVVARAQIVISNLDRLGSGGLPTVTVSGPLAQVIQIMSAGEAPSTGLAPASSATAPQAAPVSAPVPATSVSSASSPAGAAADTSGTVSSGGTQSGSLAQFGSALSSAVAAAASATSATGAGNATAGAPSASAATLASAQPAARSASAAAVGPAAIPASAPAPQTPANASGGIATPVIVISNLPNATAITTAVQNDVRSTEIQTETTITATLNSLQAVNGLALAGAIQAQVASSVGH